MLAGPSLPAILEAVFAQAPRLPSKKSPIHLKKIDFSMVSGQYQITDEWSLNLPAQFNRKIEDGLLVPFEK